jgi:two-component sensor histidine kinase
MNLEDFYRVIRNGHVRAQGIVDTVPDPLLVLDQDLTVEAANRAFHETFNVSRDETIGKHLYELGNGQWDIPDLRRLLEDVIPKSTAIIDYEVTHDFPNLGRRTMLLTAHRLHHPDNVSRTLLLSMVDATERRKREAEKDVLLGELRHRIKNLLALVHAMARQTSVEGRSGEEYRDAFLGRFHALVRAHEFAFSENKNIPLQHVVERTLEPYTSLSSAVLIEPGPPVVLAPGQLQPLSLILHELATNAVKYGALSAPNGQIRVGWTVETDDAQRLRLDWQEVGGPPASAPTSTGFGTRLIQVAAAELGGHPELAYGPEGLKAEILVSLRPSSEG